MTGIFRTRMLLTPFLRTSIFGDLYLLNLLLLQPGVASL